MELLKIQLQDAGRVTAASGNEQFYINNFATYFEGNNNFPNNSI